MDTIPKAPRNRAPRGPVTFKERDLARAIRGTTRAGLKPQRVEIERSGKIVIIPADPIREGSGNPWDSVFER